MNRRLFVLCTILLRPTAARAFTTDGQEDICADPAVIACENFENRTVGPWADTMTTPKYKNLGWGAGANNTYLAVVNTQAFDGSNSAQFTYPAGFAQDSNQGGYASLPIPPTGNLYVRAYYKLSSNWQWSANGNKLFYFGVQNPSRDSVMVDQGVWGGNQTVADMQYGINTPTNVFTQNVASVPWPLNQWVCTEIHLTMSTPGNLDGALEGWQDGTKIFNYTSISVDNNVPLTSWIKQSAYWNCATYPCDINNPADSHPLMYRWLDNLVVSTQRIGCLGNPPPPPANTPPAAPGGLKAR